MPLHVYTLIISAQRCLFHTAVLLEQSSAQGQGEGAESNNQTSQNRWTKSAAISSCNKREQCKFSEGRKKRRPSRNPADLTSYFYILLQWLWPSTRRDPRNPRTKRQRGIIMAKMAGISQLWEEAASFFFGGVTGCQWARCWEKRTAADKLGKCKMTQKQRNYMVCSEITIIINFLN